ncbi:hypothetical protein SAMD00023353_1202260 [Rosellinia necatrix]|uniref:Uncharacterized protein n=1 Tax=Rosellinia necatrix TaxID=77044 RepID=A0A1S8A6N6_ROSNE|nr:hypothetical protein SAMD00023353_1202260 [Rosellinia necatrix]
MSALEAQIWRPGNLQEKIKFVVNIGGFLPVGTYSRLNHTTRLADRTGPVATTIDR